VVNGSPWVLDPGCHGGQKRNLDSLFTPKVGDRQIPPFSRWPCSVRPGRQIPSLVLWFVFLIVAGYPDADWRTAQDRWDAADKL